MDEYPEEGKPGDLISTAIHYWPLAWEGLLTMASAELAAYPLMRIAAFLQWERGRDLGELIYYGCWLWGAHRVSRRYKLTEHEFGWSHESWQLNAALGILTALAVISCTDIFRFLLDLPAFWEAALKTGGAPVRLFTGFEHFIANLGKLGLPDILWLYLRFMVGAFAEEAFFRGAVYGAINKRDGTRWAAFWSSLVFSGVHQPLYALFFYGWKLGLDLLAIRAAVGLVFCWLRVRTQTLVAPFFCHCVHNMFVMVRFIEL